MISRFFRHGAVIGLLLGSSVASAAAQTPASIDAPLRINQNAIVLTLQTNSTHYVAGEPILLQASMHNVTGVNYYVLWLVVWQMVPIVVKDSGGHVVAPETYPDSNIHQKMPLTSELPAGQTQILKGGDRRTWEDLSHWGYGPLKPGTYTITGRLNAGVKQEDPNANGAVLDRFLTSDDQGNARTSSVTITVGSP
jgi:hypothetical protein